jgi:mono/diheme cytochrome c family protein
MKLTKKQLTINAVFCLTLLGVIIWALYAEYDRPWKGYQKEFRKLEYEINAKNESKGTALRAPTKENRNAKIKQIWLPALGEIDRCTTCHMGADRASFESLPQPFRTHTGDYLKQHPIEKFGCVICHEGQGPALSANAAHGHTENWTKPVLTDSHAQSSCAKCHSMAEGLPLNSTLAGGAAFINGWRLFNEYNCNGCHKLRGYNRTDRIGPALTSIGNKVNRDWLTQWLKAPLSYLPNTKMPEFRLSDKEIEYVVDYLMGLSKGTARRAPTQTNTTLIKEGKTLVTSLGCLGCHKLGKNGNDFAPDLSNIGNKVSPEWIISYLKNPKSYDKNSAMPAVAAADNEIQSITTYLMSLPPRSNPPPSMGMEKLPGSIVIGEKIVKEQGCTGCHEIGNLPSRQTAPELDNIGNKRTDELLLPDIPTKEKTLLSWLELKVTDPAEFNTNRIITKMPQYNLNDTEAGDMVTFLAGIKSDPIPAEYTKVLLDPNTTVIKGKKLIEKYNCQGCHKINNAGGDIAPDLTEEAKKSRPEWLFSFLKKPHKIRPSQIMKASMPDFALTDKEASVIIEYLAFVAGEPYPYNSTQRKEIPTEDIWDGEKLYKDVFACGACHIMDKNGGEVGPEHTDLASRLKRPWIEKWLRDPQSIKPDVRMPKFKFKGWEFEALTNYIMTLGQYRFVTIKNSE